MDLAPGGASDLVGIGGRVVLALWGLANAGELISEEPHAELVVGFHGGDRTVGAAPFSQTGGAEGLAGLDRSFRVGQVRDGFVSGPRAEARAVAAPLRVSVGWQRAYPDWDGIPREVADVDGGGDAVLSGLRDLRTDEWLLGLGVEANAGVASPFLDVVGTVHRSTVALAVDGAPVRYRSEAFSLGARAGLRLQVDEHVFVEAAGQGAVTGPMRWGASVGFGVAAF